MSASPHYFTWCTQPAGDKFSVVAAERDEFVLEDGERVYDFLSTSFQANFGHSNVDIRAAIHAQLDAMPIASPKASFELKRRCSEQLLKLVGLPGGKIFYTVSGSESVENALKMARQITGRTKIAARTRSYHGASLGALSVTGDWRNEPHFTVDEHTLRIPEPNADPDLVKTRRLLEQAAPTSVAAIILETITGANGVIIPEPAWFAGIQSLCDEHGILLILDEILCGFGRTGRSLALQHYERLRPDFVCMSKGISGGYIPFGAVWTGPNVAAYYESHPLTCGLTSYAHPLGLAATSAVIKLMQGVNFKTNVRALERTFARWLGHVEQHPKVQATRCKGLLAAIELAEPAPSWEECFERGLHVFSKQNMIVLAPPLTSTPNRLQAACDNLFALLP